MRHVNSDDASFECSRQAVCPHCGGQETCDKETNVVVFVSHTESNKISIFASRQGLATAANLCCT